MLESAALVQTGLGALGLLVGQQLLARLFFVPARARNESTMSPRSHDDESTMVDRVHDGRPRPDRGQGGGVQGLCNVVGADTTDATSAAEHGVCFLPAVDHVAGFIEWLTTDDEGAVCRIVRSDRQLFSDYLQWARKHCVVPLPEKTLQTLLGRNARVAKDRPIKKCPKTGRALYLSTGSPDRWTRYTINPPRRDAGLPGKPPVVDLVPERPALTKRQREQQRAAAQPGQLAETFSADAEWASEAQRKKAA